MRSATERQLEIIGEALSRLSCTMRIRPTNGEGGERRGVVGRGRVGKLPAVVIVCLLLAPGIAASPTEATDTFVGPTDRGWYTSEGYHDPTNENYVIGDDGSIGGIDRVYRAFLVFDLPASVETIVKAELQLYQPRVGYGSSDATEQLVLYDVTTPVADVRAGGSGLIGIWADLGSGSTYGKANVSAADNDTMVHVPLNATFVHLAQTGGVIAIGGGLGSLDSSPTTAEQIVIGTANYHAVRLKLTTAKLQPDGQPTPPPPTLPPRTSAPPSSATPVQLTERPLVFFGPLPPLLVGGFGRPYVGAEDYMRLFEEGAAWDRAAERIHVFKFPGEWVHDVPWTVHATDEELERAVAELNRRGIAIGFEAGPLLPTQTCGENVEGFAGITPSLDIGRRIEAAGGTVRYIALDEPFAFATIYDGDNACGWSVGRVAREVHAYIEAMEDEFPGVVVGDIEPLWNAVDPAVFEEWFDTYRQVAGEHLPFFHLDMDWVRSEWPDAAKQVEDAAHDRGIEFGLIYIGSQADQTDEAWLADAGQRALDYEDGAGGAPDHLIFQSWLDRPDRTLPDNDPATFTGLIVRYFEDRGTIGIGALDVAYRREATASNALPGFPPGHAVDGNPDTWWGSGGPPPQWIEIDLGRRVKIGQIRLLISQDPAGRTVHRVFGRVSRDGPLVHLHTFAGRTEDLQTLVFDAPRRTKIRFLRIETLAGPSWVSWREIIVTRAS